MRLTYASLGLLFPPVPKYTDQDLPSLYAKLCKVHPFESFRQRGDGAVLTTEAARTLTLDRQTLVLEEYVRTDIVAVRRTFSDIVKTIKDELKIAVFFAPRIEYRLSMPMQDAGTVLRETALSIKKSQFDLLKAHEIHSVGIVINFDADSDHHHMSLDISPEISDPNYLEAQLESVRHETIDSIAIVDQFMGDDYNYLTKNALQFVNVIVSQDR